jgi:hypothetical protein
MALSVTAKVACLNVTVALNRAFLDDKASTVNRHDFVLRRLL